MLRASNGRSLALSACLVVVLLIQSVLPAAASSAAPARLAEPPTAEASLVFAPSQQDGGTIPPEEPAPSGEPLPDPDAPPEPAPPHDTPPPIPFDVQLVVSSLTIRPGQVVRAAFVVERRTAFDLPWRVRFTLEQGLVTTDGRRMDIFFDMAAGEENSRLEREFDILLEDDVAVDTYPVKKVRVEATMSGYTKQYERKLIGVLPAQAQAASALEAQQGPGGAVLAPPGEGVVLATEPESLPPGARLSYTPLFRAGRPAQPANALYLPAIAGRNSASQPSPADAGQTPFPGPTLHLPLVNAQPEASAEAATEEDAAAEVTAAATLTESAPLTVTLVPTSLDGIQFYQLWRLESTPDQGGFAHPVMLIADVGWLIDAGVDVAALQVWTREDATQPWAPMDAQLDIDHRAFIVELPHFSEFGIGNGLTQGGDMLPTTKGYVSDRFTGHASVNVPIETPKGLGGMSPGLSLNYSTSQIDDLVMQGQDDMYVVQASPVGWGWDIGGVSAITRVDSDDGVEPLEQRVYSLVVNGVRADIKWLNGELRTDPELFAKIEHNQHATGNARDVGEWVVTMPDGTVYLFGDPFGTTQAPLYDVHAFAANRATETLLTNLNTSQRPARLGVRWLLRSVTDPLGNRIKYNYAAESRVIDSSSCVSGSSQWFQTKDRRWYTTATMLSSVYWSANSDAENDSHFSFRAVFDYETGRTDVRVPGYNLNPDCKQYKYTGKRLERVTVQAWNSQSNGWTTLRAYDLNHAYHTASYRHYGHNVRSHLVLENIRHLGAGGTALLRTEDFNYTEWLGERSTVQELNDQSINNYRLTEALNGWGGKVVFSYQRHEVGSCNNSGRCTAGRYPVISTQTHDGMENVATVSYAYGESRVRETSDKALTFMGYVSNIATFYSLDGGKYKEELTTFYQGTEGKPHPALGKPKQVRTEGMRGSAWDVWSQTNYVWASYKRTSNGWVWVDPNVASEAPVWPRLEATKEWVDKAGAVVRLFYEPGRQGGGQYGNVTEKQELSYAGDTPEVSLATWTADTAWVDTATAKAPPGNSAIAVLRTTVTTYFPNTANGKYIVAAPGRVRTYAGLPAANMTDNCKGETRTSYLAPADGTGGRHLAFSQPPMTTLPARVETALTSCAADGDASTVALSSANWGLTLYTYDTYGNQIKTTNFLDAVASPAVETLVTDYEQVYHLFPIRQYMDGHPTYAETARYWGVSAGLPASAGGAPWGAMAEHCAMNGVCTRQDYDPFGRPVYRWEKVPATTAFDPAGQQSTASAWWIYRAPGAYSNPTNPTYIVTEWRRPRGWGNFTREHYNGLGQLVAVQTPYQDWEHANGVMDQCGVPGTTPCADEDNQGQEVHVYYAYDAFGRQLYASTPQLKGRSGAETRAYTVNWGATAKSATYYDPLGRPTTRIEPSGRKTRFFYAGRYSYQGEYLYGSDQTFQISHWRMVDGLGHLRWVRDYSLRTAQAVSPAVRAQVTLTHDVMGNLTRAELPSGRTASFSYDLGGRKLSMSDPDLGAWSYSYDRTGRLVSRTDACGGRVTMSYDFLGRVASKTAVAGAGCANSFAQYVVTYSYDQGHGSSNRSLGRLTGVALSDGSYSKSLAYDGSGRLKSETVAIAGAPASYTTGYGYDAYHRLRTLTYPDGEVVTTDYNSMGLPARLTSSVSGALVNGGADWGQAADGAQYDEAGRLVAVRHPPDGSLWQSYVYAPFTQQDPNAGRLTSIRLGTAVNGSDRYFWNYSYDSYGNVASLNQNGESASFSYDAQNRLLSAYGSSYAWASSGRATSFGGAAFAYNAAPVHAVNMVAGVDRYDYDAAGNMTRRRVGATVQTLVWDQENRLRTVRVGTSDIERYRYDDAGIRVKRESGGQAYYYPFAHYEVHGGVAVKYYFFGGQRIAVRKSSAPDDVVYLSANHLASVEAASRNGAVTGTRKHNAFGASRGATGTMPTELGFTGRPHDATGLVYMNARYYDPVIGQFVSPDTIVPDPTVVMDYNRYLYARGNPLKYNDPTGHSGQVPCMCGGYVGASEYVRREGNRMAVEAVHAALNVAGTVLPPADAINAGIYAVEGDWSNAGWSTLAIIPLLGDAAKSGKYLDKVSGIKEIFRVGRQTEELTGQVHHVLSNKVMTALQNHPTLTNSFEREWMRVRAASLSDHYGYETWHIDYDGELVEWLSRHRDATPTVFMDKLIEMYQRPEMVEKFPTAVDSLVWARQEIEQAQKAVLGP